MVGRLIRQLVPSEPLILLTPASRDLGLEASRALDELGIWQAPVDALLPADPAAELHLDLSTVLHGRLHAKPRLVIRQKARSVVLDGNNVVVPPQPFDLLVLLVGRVLENGGHANPRDIEDALFPGMVHGHAVTDIVRRLRLAFAPFGGGKSNAEALIEPVRLSARPPAPGDRTGLNPHSPDEAGV